MENHKEVNNPIVLAKNKNLARPWVRYWARCFDIAVHVFFLSVVWTLIDAKSLESIPYILFYFVFLFLWIFIEGFYMGVLGTTPGKKLLKVQVQTKEGKKVSFYTGFKRARMVWLKGMGLGLGVISLVTNLLSYNKLDNEGSTSWDNKLGLLVKHEKIGWIRVMVCVLVLILLYGAGILSLLLK